MPLRLLSELRCLLDEREAGAPAAGASEAPSAPASAPSNTARRRKSGAAASSSGRQPEGPSLAMLPGHSGENESGACLGGGTEAQGSNLGSCLTASIPGMACCLPASCRSHVSVLFMTRSQLMIYVHIWVPASMPAEPSRVLKYILGSRSGCPHSSEEDAVCYPHGLPV